jgi:acetyl esterase/lipase
MTLYRRIVGAFCGLVLATGFGVSAHAQAPAGEILLWPNGAPGANRMKLEQTPSTSQGGMQVVTGVTRPSLTLYRPSGPFTKAVLVVPGGGFRNVVVGKEGHDIARWLAQNGIAAGVLTYRLPVDNWPQGGDAIMLEDAQRAIRLLRRETGAAKVGVLGFSAGGRIAVLLDGGADKKAYAPLDDADKLSAKPDFVGLGYGAFNPRDMARVPAPAFIFHGADDAKVSVARAQAAYAAFTQAGAKAELHIFKQTDHGFALQSPPGSPSAAWPQLFLDWLKRL